MNFNLEELKKDESLLVDFIDFFFGFKIYKYQLRFLNKCLNHNRIAGKWPRQTGKSQTVAFYSLIRAIFERTTILIVAPTQNQSTELYNKIRELANNSAEIRSLITKSTESEMRFSNGSRIISLPCGPYGATIRGYTCDVLIIEEAGIMKDNIVNTVLIPMLASKGDKGQIIKIGTPLTRNHFYRSCFEDKDYIVINVTWKDALEVGQYTQSFIDEQKAQLTDVEFRTEYDAEFLYDTLGLFPPELLEECMLNYPLVRLL